jgi:hypothetical protein
MLAAPDPVFADGWGVGFHSRHDLAFPALLCYDNGD